MAVQNKESHNRRMREHRLKVQTITFEMPKEKYLEVQSFIELNNFKNRKEFIMAAIDYYMYRET